VLNGEWWVRKAKKEKEKVQEKKETRRCDDLKQVRYGPHFIKPHAAGVGVRGEALHAKGWPVG